MRVAHVQLGGEPAVETQRGQPERLFLTQVMRTAIARHAAHHALLETNVHDTASSGRSRKLTLVLSLLAAVHATQVIAQAPAAFQQQVHQPRVLGEARRIAQHLRRILHVAAGLGRVDRQPAARVVSAHTVATGASAEDAFRCEPVSIISRSRA